MFQYLRLTSLSHFAGQKHLVNYGIDLKQKAKKSAIAEIGSKNGAHLVKVENEIQFTDVVKVFVEHFDEVVNGFQVVQVVVADVNADAEVKAGVTAVDDFEIAELKGGSG